MYSLFNLFGLAVGMTCSILILLYVLHELSYDRYRENSSTRIYRLANTNSLWQPAPLGLTLKREIPEISRFSRLLNPVHPLISYEDKKFYEKVYLADADFFELIAFPWIQGDRRSALREPYSMVISTAIAEKYFGEENPINKVITWDDTHEYRITGVFDLPTNTHFPCHWVASAKTISVEPSWGPIHLDDWNSYFENYFNTYLYLQLPEDYPVAHFERHVLEIIEKHMGQEWLGDIKRDGNLPWLQPISDIHLYSHYPSELQVNGSTAYVYTLAVIAVLVLFISCLNFANLYTAQCATRVREVGMRKVMGADRLSFLYQFLCESFLLTTLSLLLALPLVSMAMKPFSTFTGKELSWQLAGEVYVLAGGICLVGLIGILGGIYPALFLAAPQPVAILKGNGKTGSQGTWFRKGLVVFQCAVSIFLIIVTAGVYKQLEYLEERDLGFEKESLVVFRTGYPGVEEKAKTLQQTLSQLPDVAHVTRFYYIPTGLYPSWTFSTLARRESPEQKITAPLLPVDERFITTFGIQIRAGRNFSAERPGEKGRAVILNEAAAVALHFASPDEALGRRVLIEGPGEVIVVGIAANFHFESLHHSIRPVVLYYPENDDPFGAMGIKVNAGHVASTLEHIQATWSQIISFYPMIYDFLDDTFSQLYRSEKQLSTILGIFVILAVAIACIGVFAITAFTVERRKKEIGIRKVLGATRWDISVLFAKDLALLLLIANLVTWPAAYYTTSMWLQDFAYRIDFSVLFCLVGGGGIFCIAFCAMGYHIYKALVANPIDAIKYE